jgi:hypothetical protein
MKSRTCIIGLAALAFSPAAVVLISLLTGCQAGTTGTFRPIDPATLTSITNTIVGASQAAASVLPTPFGSIFEGVGAVAVAALAVWQTLTHRTVTANTTAITSLKNGSSNTPKV